MPCSQAAHSDHMHIIVNRLLSHFLRSREQRSNIYIKADICEP